MADLALAAFVSRSTAKASFSDRMARFGLAMSMVREITHSYFLRA